LQTELEEYSPVKKRAYHTDLILCFQLNLLPPEELKNIPSSTRDYWKKIDLTKHYGYDFNSCQSDVLTLKTIASNKKLIRIGKAICHVYMAYKSIISDINSSKKVIRQNAKTVVDTITRVSPTLGLKRAVKLFGISIRQFYNWKNKVDCRISVLNLCRKKHPFQLTENEIEVLKSYVYRVDLLNWSLSSVYWKMIRDGAAYMSYSTFCKYTRLVFADRKKYRIKKRKNKTGIRAKRPLEILHMDVTIFRPIDNSKVYIYIIMDNFSRAILGWKASLLYKSEITLENLKEVCTKYNLWYKPLQLITDDGPENNGVVNSYLLLDNLNIIKQVALRDIEFSNSMVEAVNKQIKYQFLFTNTIANLNETILHMHKSVDEYNHKPINSLFGLTPNEVLNEIFIPDKYMFAEQKKIAKLNRVETNRELSCTDCD